tara:strand:- start:30189 stop:30677 length:489 start_codon:yes stop_codon:yes gene_type:complete
MKYQSLKLIETKFTSNGHALSAKLARKLNIPKSVKTKMLDGTAKTAFGAIKRNLMGPYSLNALKRMGHPYATKHGSILISPKNRVNKQDGDMIRSLKIKRGGGVRKIYFDDSIAPHAKWVIDGTDKMLPRSVLQSSITKRTINYMHKAAEKHFIRWASSVRA